MLGGGLLAGQLSWILPPCLREEGQLVGLLPVIASPSEGPC